MSLFELPRKKMLRSVEFFCLFFLSVLLSGCLPKEFVELRSGVRWEYVDSTHSKLIFDDAEVLGPAHISLQIRDDCIFGLYHEGGKTSIFMFEFKNRNLRTYPYSPRRERPDISAAPLGLGQNGWAHCSRG